jgi:hypothetical protein
MRRPPPSARVRPPSNVASRWATYISDIALAFKPSPFHRVDQHVSQVVEGPGQISRVCAHRDIDCISESTSSSDRRQATLLFTLTEEQQAKLKSSKCVLC